jgi:hypothetical protein
VEVRRIGVAEALWLGWPKYLDVNRGMEGFVFVSELSSPKGCR